MTLPDWRRPSEASIVLALPLACLALAACGSTSGKSASVAAAGTTSPAAATTGIAVRQCLQTNGITLPPRAAGTRRPQATGTTTGGGLGLGLGGGGGRGGGGGFARRLPPGVTQAQFQAALKKCGGAGAPATRRFDTPAAKQALASFSACMRKKGFALPPPNTSGTGPLFKTTAITAAAPAFQAAAAGCRPLLGGVLGRGPVGRGAAQSTQ